MQGERERGGDTGLPTPVAYVGHTDISVSAITSLVMLFGHSFKYSLYISNSETYISSLELSP